MIANLRPDPIGSTTGIDPDALLGELATGKGDGEILAWIEANATRPRDPWEIASWSAYHLQRGPDSDAETLTHFTELVAKFSTTRVDIRTWFDLLGLDDYCTFGGRA